MRAALVLLALLGCGGEPVESWRAQVDAWTWPDPIPDFALVDQDGASFRLGELRDRWVLMGFVFTRCGNAAACPLTMRKMQQVREEWASHPHASNTPLHLLSVTLDPAWDTPERLHAYGASYGAERSSWTLATGEPELVSDALPTLLGVLALPDPSVGIKHTVKVALLRPGLELHAEWTDNQFTVEEVLSHLSPPPVSGGSGRRTPVEVIPAADSE